MADKTLPHTWYIGLVAGPGGVTQVELFKRLHLPAKKHAKRVRNLADAAGIRV